MSRRLLLAIALFAFGCGGSKEPTQEPIDSGTDAETDTAVDAGCTADDQCPSATCSAGVCRNGACALAPKTLGTACGDSVCDGTGLCGECKPTETRCTSTTGAPEMEACDATGHWKSAPACTGATPFCANGACVECMEDTTCSSLDGECTLGRCIDHTCKKTARAAGTVCGDSVCDGGGGCGACKPMDVRCKLGTTSDIERCDSTGAWVAQAPCAGPTPLCLSAACVECTRDSECAPRGECWSAACVANKCVHTAKTSGATCTGSVCDGSGACGVCVPSATRCKVTTSGPGVLETCDPTGQRWNESTCARACVAGACAATALCFVGAMQNLVVIVGGLGSHGYAHLLFPHPDAFANRQSDHLAVHALQTSASNGATGSTLSGTLANTVDYVSPAASLGFASGERFRRIYGADNQAFLGFRSGDSGSQTIDIAFWGSATLPSNSVTGVDRKFVVATRETPWIQKYGLKKAITGIEGGLIDSYPSRAPSMWVDKASGWSVFAAAAVLEKVRPTITPVVFMGDFGTTMSGSSPLPLYGDPVGAPPAMLVADINAYALRLHSGGINLDDKLLPTSADRTRYGFTGSTPVKLARFRDALIGAAKMLRLGLTSQVVIPGFDDDPSGLFSSSGVDGVNAATAATYLSNVLRAFEDDLMELPDPFCPGVKLGDNTVIAFVGDTPRSMIEKGVGWSTSTLGGQGRTYVMSNGQLRSGFFGGERPRSVGDTGPGEGGLFDLTTGDLLPFDSTGVGLIGGRDLRAQYGQTAMAAILCAIARDDLLLVNEHYTGPNFPVLQVPRPL